MTMTREAEDIFTDARQLHASALERLAAGDIRDAAEKAWGATLRASNALVLARTGAEPEIPAETALGLRKLQDADETVRQARLVARYYTRQGSLHGHCFYLGLCEPVRDTEHRIRETADYIDDAERLARS
jgi:hypothetical protein